jgi:hypothetical protein
MDERVRGEATKIHTLETRAKFSGGIVFPFKFGDDNNPFVILGCIPELSSIFETKTRAPFKIVFEVCRLSELIDEVQHQDVAEVSLDAASPGLHREEVKEEKEVDEVDGGGTGGVGMFSMTMGDDGVEENNLVADNPFGMDDDE